MWWPFRTWEYVGTVEGVTQWESGSQSLACWILHKSGSHRRYEFVGDKGYSAHYTRMKSEVHAWVAGGPMPSEMKSAPAHIAPKPTADLIVFPGGKK